jgi:hypothetical protein
VPLPSFSRCATAVATVELPQSYAATTTDRHHHPAAAATTTTSPTTTAIATATTTDKEVDGNVWVNG